MERIADALKEAGAYLTAHPDEASYTDSVARATIEDGLRARVVGTNGEELTTDMPASVGGAATAPSPGWFLRAAEAACVATLLAMRAAQLGLDPGRVTVEVDSQSDDRGILGLDDGVAAGPLTTRVAVEFATASADPADLRALAEWAIDHCPVVDAVRRSIPMSVDVTVSP